MTRERKEIYKEMDKLYQQEQAEFELGCGFCTSEISSAFEAEWDRLYNKLAATYGKTAQEYESMQYETQNRLVAAGVFPF